MISLFELFQRRKQPARYVTPGGPVPTVYDMLTKQTHILIAGKTGAGKSVVINGIIYTLLSQYFPEECKLILIDPKRVELMNWKQTKHCILYASEPGEPAQALQKALDITEKRYKAMQGRKERKYTGGHVYIIIDELADLMTTDKRNVVPLLQRLAQIGRAANIHIIAATQCPLSEIIPTKIKVNFDCIIGLKTATKQHSRNITGLPGCELLAPYGSGYIITPKETKLYKLPMIQENELLQLAEHWTR